MNRDADAGATAASAASAATRSTAASASGVLRNRRVLSQGRDRAAQPVLEIDLGLPAEELLRSRDLRLADLRVVDRQRLEDDLARRAGHSKDRLRQLEQGFLVGIAEVDRQVLARLGEQYEAADQVVDVAEAARLRPVAEDGERLLRERLTQER